MKISDLKVGDKFISEKLNNDKHIIIDADGCLLLADGDDEVKLI